MELASMTLVNQVKKNKLVALVINPKAIESGELTRMYHLFCQYYEGHPFETFKKDLYEKEDVILLKDSRSKEIQGFSTILKVKITKDNKDYYGIYSGDTVVANEYWGSPALGIMFLKYLWMQKIKNPFRPLYWFLISKGYKTYLLMANNFVVHYPRYEENTKSHHQELMNSFYSKKFKESYHGKENLVIPSGDTCHLKSDVADIHCELLGLPRVKFFQEKNPKWQEGVELCCIAEMSIVMPAKYMLKKMIKGLFK
ncbi:hypothetical protein SHI21_12245 [Bacteriovorax sp. PP10]|uniref:GNAT family N-acetyltransferase n=1 Tax=Bacteriovorax antarcticus TaxID=3088717 RepID=A0ABU5VVK4_9BACT|nr:hypothetical protein [Bacteriovorax sp. PP10]MEA9356986.1 hypothetical protein [Bacteriovorax sp. PP10]